jgi:hypothetical protein
MNGECPEKKDQDNKDSESDNHITKNINEAERL